LRRAGNVREISENAMYLVHEAWGFTMGTEKVLADELENLRTINANMAKLYAKRAGGDEATFRAIMAEKDGIGRWITAQDAVDKGFADTIIEMKPVVNGFFGNMMSMFRQQDS
jgi:ATP-dependent Clp protease, protease subunit